MSIIRITNPDEIKSGHVVMVGLLFFALAGNCLLTSAGKPRALPDGAVDWKPDSILLALVEILDLHYAQPTPNGVEIKALVHGTAAALGILIATLGIVARARSPEGPDRSDSVIDIDVLTARSKPAATLARRQLNPILTAQALMLGYLAWSFASQWWSHAPDFSRGGSILLAIETAWAFTLAYGLNRRAAVWSAYAMLIVLVATACLAVGYHGERNPTLRASYPIGNPLFLAAFLIPGLLIAIVTMALGLGDTLDRRRGRGGLKIAVSLVAAGLLAYAFQLTDARGPAVGMVVGVAAIIFLASKRKLRIAVAVATFAVLAALGAYFVSQRQVESPTGRSASMRSRFYAWNYALNLLRERPLTGHGQGGYTLLADVFASADVEVDPMALDRRIAHAHSEWLEVGSDLGSVGLVLVAGALTLTLAGGAQHLARESSRRSRWILVGLLGSLAAFLVDECFNVGLRIEGLPLVYFTVIGLIWAMARPVSPGLLLHFAQRRWLSLLAVVASAAACLTIVEYARRDFAAARALYDAGMALEAGQWDKAATLSERAVQDRLAVQRKLIALRHAVSTRLEIATQLQAQYVRRRQADETSAAFDPRLHAAVLKDRSECETHVAAGMEALARLRSVAPSEINAGWLEYGLRDVLAGFADIDGNVQAAQQHRHAGAEALRRQMTRQPFDPDLAAQYVVVAGDQLSPAEAIDLLGRPLRTQRIPTSYLDLLGGLALNDAYEHVLVPIFDECAAQIQFGDPSLWSDRWAPEKLRLGAIAALARSNYDGAVRYLQLAVRLYAILDKDVPLAEASCWAELGDALFLLRPDAAQQAIDAAEAALRVAPPSEPGRALCDAIAVRLISYHLAADHEEFARGLIRRGLPPLADKELDAIVADGYVRIAYRFFSQARQETPEQLRVWSRRALELDPDSVPAWFLAADLCIVDGNDQAAARCIREVIERGSDPKDTQAIINRATEAMPASQALRELKEQYRKQQQSPGAPAGTATSVPADEE